MHSPLRVRILGIVNYCSTRVFRGPGLKKSERAVRMRLRLVIRCENNGTMIENFHPKVTERGIREGFHPFWTSHSLIETFFDCSQTLLFVILSKLSPFKTKVKTSNILHKFLQIEAFFPNFPPTLFFSRGKNLIQIF